MKKEAAIVIIYSIIHFAADFSCVLLLSGLITPATSGGYELFACMVLYNFFAFVFQIPVGIFADRFNKNALVSAAGCGLIILGCILSAFNILACIVAGMGNALFHIGGGIDVLNISKKKAGPVGVFVAPGALGLFLGSNMAKSTIGRYYIILFIIVGMALSIGLLLYLYKNVIKVYDLNNEKPKGIKINNKEAAILACMLVTICIRGYTGLILNFSWKTNFLTAFIFVGGVVMGKVLGGVAGDRIGWLKSSAVSLALSAVLFIFAFDNAVFGIIAVFLFNMTMPITLTCLSNIFNENKGFAFGLTTASLFVGAVPVFIGITGVFFNKAAIFTLVIISAAVLFAGLYLYEKQNKKRTV